MLKPEIFLDAAERVEQGAFCCCYALYHAENDGATCENYFDGWFHPQRGIDYEGRYDPYWMRMGYNADDEHGVRERRVLALCLAAAMVAAGETPF